jgi:hypothetical protein
VLPFAEQEAMMVKLEGWTLGVSDGCSEEGVELCQKGANADQQEKNAKRKWVDAEKRANERVIE